MERQMWVTAHGAGHECCPGPDPTQESDQGLTAYERLILEGYVW